MIIPCSNFRDYSYRNHSNKIVTFDFRSSKRVKTKVLQFIKNNHILSDINKYLDEFNLEIALDYKSKKYIHYLIVDKEMIKNEN